MRFTPMSVTGAPGARVNGKMVPLRTRLRNGDIVQVITTPGHHPSRDWLNFVVTSRARNKIKHYIHAEEKDRSLDLGKKVFEKEARRYGLNLKSLTEGPAFAAALSDYGYSKAEELFIALGYGKLAVKSVLAKLVPQEQLKETPESGLAQVASAVRRLVGSGEEKIKVRGFDDLMVFRARCCNPIRGEKIVGYITRGKGVSVHSAACPNVVNLLYDPDRRIDVEWDKGDRRIALHRAAQPAGGRSEGHPRGRDVEDRRHQHQHPQRRSDLRRRPAGPHRHDGRDHRREASAEGDQVAAQCRGRGRRGAGEPVRRAPTDKL